MAAVAEGVAGGVSAALGSDSGELGKIRTKINNFVCQILPKLDKGTIAKIEINLCESYCLLWHHLGLGIVDGRQTSDILIFCAYAAVVLDLWVASKADIEIKGRITDEYVEAVLKVW